MYIASSSPQEFRAAGLVRVDPPAGSTLKQATATYTELVTSPQTINATAAALELTPAEVRGLLKARERSANGAPSGLVDVVYRGPDQEAAPAIVTTSAVVGLQSLYTGPIAEAESVVEVAEQSFASATEAAEAAGVLRLQAEEKAYQSRLNFLRNSGNGTEDEIAAVQATLDGIRDELAASAALVNELESAERILNNARRSLTKTEAQLAAASDPAIVQLSAVTAINQSTDSVRAGVTGALIGFALAAAVVLAIVMMRLRPTPDEEQTATRDGDESATDKTTSTAAALKSVSPHVRGRHA